MIRPTILWYRKDLRLSDHPALTAAVQRGGPVIPVFVRDHSVDALGAAPKWRLDAGLSAFSAALADRGSALIFRSGQALAVLQALIAETGADAVFWTRAYDPHSITRDTALKSALKEQGVSARSFGGHVMFEPWSVETKAGGFFKVYSPMWRAVRDRVVDPLIAPPRTLKTPKNWPASERLSDWHLSRQMNRGAAVLAQHANVGESAAQERLDTFIAHRVHSYKDRRDLPSVAGTSNLSENLAIGEISPHRCWHKGQSALAQGKAGAETFLKELVWREFAYHLMYHSPHILSSNWKEKWDAFPWSTDETAPHVLAWKQGRTGIRFVDAAMREMYVTGRMHNRSRMIVASYLTKHLMTHWKIGLKWFEDCLTDWDPASNAMGWQWAAGSGPDAAPYFRVFNPVSQLEKFDKDNAYARAWIAEGQLDPPTTALSYFDAVPRGWRLSARTPYPAPVVSAQEGRKRALAAYEARLF